MKGMKEDLNMNQQMRPESSTAKQLNVNFLLHVEVLI